MNLLPRGSRIAIQLPKVVAPVGRFGLSQKLKHTFPGYDDVAVHQRIVVEETPYRILLDFRDKTFSFTPHCLNSRPGGLDTRIPLLASHGR